MGIEHSNDSNGDCDIYFEQRKFQFPIEAVWSFL